MSTEYFSSYDGKTVMAAVDVNGNSLELTIEDEKVKAIGNIPVGGGDESVWTDETFNALADDNNGDDIQDEEGNSIGDETAETLWATRDGVGFKAKRAEADINGNSLELTIEDNKVVEIGGHTLNGGTIDAYTKTQTNALLADKADIISDGTENNLISLANDGNINDSGIAASDVATSVQNSHSHSNKAVLDEIPVRSGTDSAMLYSADDSSSIAWKNWSYVTVSKKTANSVLIGKTWYPYVKIGNLYWTTENLREPIGTKNIDYRIYDESTVVQRGYLYSKHAILKSNDQEATHTLLEESDAMQALLHDGWHVPTENELNSLCSLKGGYDGGHHFFATDAFDVGGVVYSREPLDTYGYKGYPSGYYSDNQYHSMQNYLFTMAKNAAYNGQICAWYLDLMPGSWTNTMSQVNKNSFVSVRLCKSAI